jgi:hypothetical protein
MLLVTWLAMLAMLAMSISSEIWGAESVAYILIIAPPLPEFPAPFFFPIISPGAAAARRASTGA